MPSPSTAARAEAARRAVLSQTELLHSQFGRAETRWKADGTRVTPVDIAISEAIFAQLSAAFPDDQFFSEESAGIAGAVPVTSRYCWILDPIDGTNNYAIGIPHCAISLALVEAGEPVYGAVYDLSRRRLMHGGPEFGAWDGDSPMPAVVAPPARECIVGFHSPFDKKLVPKAQGILGQFKIRGLGSATLHLAYVAAGLLDGAVDFNVKIWDLAAAIPLCRAAGAEVRFLNGAQTPIRQFDLNMRRIVYVAGTPAMCDVLEKLMQ
jgi:myo-inositol-1(or 4)-monophosphatase